MKTAAFPTPTGALCDHLPDSHPAPRPAMEIIHVLRKTARSIILTGNDLLHLSVDGGIAWVTMEGDPDDHILSHPEPMGFAGPGRLVIEAVEGDIRVRLTNRAPLAEQGTCKQFSLSDK